MNNNILDLINQLKTINADEQFIVNEDGELIVQNKEIKLPLGYSIDNYGVIVGPNNNEIIKIQISDAKNTTDYFFDNYQSNAITDFTQKIELANTELIYKNYYSSNLYWAVNTYTRMYEEYKDNSEFITLENKLKKIIDASSLKRQEACDTGKTRKKETFFSKIKKIFKTLFEDEDNKEFYNRVSGNFQEESEKFKKTKQLFDNLYSNNVTVKNENENNLERILAKKNLFSNIDTIFEKNDQEEMAIKEKRLASIDCIFNSYNNNSNNIIEAKNNSIIKKTNCKINRTKIEEIDSYISDHDVKTILENTKKEYITKMCFDKLNYERINNGIMRQLVKNPEIKKELIEYRKVNKDKFTNNKEAVLSFFANVRHNDFIDAFENHPKIIKQREKELNKNNPNYFLDECKKGLYIRKNINETQLSGLIRNSLERGYNIDDEEKFIEDYKIFQDKVRAKWYQSREKNNNS